MAVKTKRLLWVGLLARLLLAQIYSSNLPLDHSAVNYRGGKLDDAVTRLAAKPTDLPTLLQAFDINPDTQALVYSQTSFQGSKISPRNPRAIYFNDEVAVGWVRGGDGIEVAARDPRQGVIFYGFKDGVFTRREECLHCHTGSATLGVPGMFVGSVFPNAFGRPDRTGAIITDHRTPFADRWGGWYVTAAHGQQLDRSNAIAPDPAEPHALMTDGRQNLTTLMREFNTAGYLSPLSDIVALMTFEHQTQMANFFTRLNWESRIADPQLDADIKAAVKYMLFVDEAPLKEPIEGVSTFTKTFPQRGPRDLQGRSLRDFDLQKRLFRYPLSYMIYSRAFDALPDSVRSRIYRRLYDTLGGFPAPDRKAIIEILRDTKPGLPPYWKDQV